MKRILMATVGAALAASLMASASVKPVFPGSTVNREAEPGDDRGRGEKAEPGDDRGRNRGGKLMAREAEPGDDRGRGKKAEPGDDRGRNRGGKG